MSLGKATYGLDVFALGGFGRHVGGLFLEVVVALSPTLIHVGTEGGVEVKYTTPSSPKRDFVK